MSERDEKLGAALRELRVPEHRPGFWDELEAGLAEHAPDKARAARRGWLPPLPSPRWALALAASAVAAAVIVVGVPHTDVAPSRALAEIVRERVAEAVADLRTLRGRFAYRSATEDPRTGIVEGIGRYEFALTDNGDFRITALDGTEDTAYDATAGIQRSLFPSSSLGGGRFYSERRGLPPGPPDIGPAELILERELGAVVRALLASGDPAIEETTYEGRPAWRVELEVEPNLIPGAADFDLIDLTVDQASGLPVLVRRTLDGRFRSELEVTDLEVNAPLSRTTFELSFPPGEQVSRTDGGFRRLELDEVGTAVGYPPLFPTALPAGFELSEIAVADDGGFTGAEGGNPPSRGVVSLSYRRGFDEVIVTTRLAAVRSDRPELRNLPPEELWSDPFAGEGVRERREPFTLSGGALAGASGELVIGPRSIPHVWVLGDELVATVAGDLSRAELLEVAESLAPREG